MRTQPKNGLWSCYLTKVSPFEHGIGDASRAPFLSFVLRSPLGLGKEHQAKSWTAELWLFFCPSF